MTRAVGIDLSLTGTGLAAVTTLNGGVGTGLVTRTIKSTGKQDDTLRQRARRVRRIVDDVVSFALNADIVVIEGPSFMSKGGSNWDRAGLWWSVVDALLLDAHHVAVAPPTVVKKFAAGKGNADKTAVAGGLVRLWGERCNASNDNEYDALTMATMGAQHLAMPDVPTRAHHEATLASVAWDQPEGAAA